MTILPLTYLGSAEWWRCLLEGDAIVDVGENYVKQSARNRCEILTEAGIMPLTVNVVKGASIHKKKVRDMRIDYSKRWQHLHSTAIRSAYKKSPYYDYCADRFAMLYEHHYEWLYDFNRDAALSVLDILKLPHEALSFSEEWVLPSAADRDLRGHDFLGRTDSTNLYYQVFSERIPFVPNLSVIDLIFCEGRSAREMLR